MSTEFNDAVRQNVPLLILLAGGTGSGKTESALRLATGMSGGKPFAVIDTERGRALHKADDYAFKHAPFEEPFTPERYSEKVKDADDAGFPVVVVDSGSHEWEGIGGILDMQTAEYERMGAKESARMASWIAPKQRHKRFVQQLLRTRAHIILCLRAEDKIEIVKVNGKTEVRPKESLVGAQGWIPICEKRLPFEATISLLLTADAPGVPKPVKLERRHTDLISLDRPLDEETGKRLAAWAAGSAPGYRASPTTSGASDEGNESGTGADSSSAGDPQADTKPSDEAALTVEAAQSSAAVSGAGEDEPPSPADILQLVTALVGASGRPDATAAAIEAHAAAHPPERHFAWLRAQAEKKGLVAA